MTGDEELASEKPCDDKEKISEPMTSTIELKIEQIEPVGNTVWSSLEIPTEADHFNLCQTQVNNGFSAPLQGSQVVPQLTSEYTFGAPPSFDCQQQISFTYNDPFAPMSNYWPVQTEFQDILGEFSTTNEHYPLGEHQWIQ